MSHISVRNCAACRVKLPKRELVRIVRTPQGRIEYDPTSKADGRGLYWCGRESCLGIIRKKGMVARFLRIKPSEDLFAQLEGVISGK